MTFLEPAFFPFEESTPRATHDKEAWLAGLLVAGWQRAAGVQLPGTEGAAGR